MKRPYILAEVANAHEGKFGLFKQIIQEASRSGAQGVKFQIIISEELVARSSPQRSVFDKLEFTRDQWMDIFQFARDHGLEIWTDVYGLQGLAIADAFKEIHGYKAHTSDILNGELLRQLGKRGRPILLSCSGSTDLEIANAINLLRSDNESVTIILMHGFQSYPTPLQETNLQGINRLRSVFALPVGIQDHVDGGSEAAVLIPILASALGVELIEKHITYDRSRKGTDYYSSLDPADFKRMADYIHTLSDAVGNSQGERTLSEAEKQYALSAKKKLIARSTLSSGQVLTDKHFVFKRVDSPAFSLWPEDVIGLCAKRDIHPEQIICFEDLDVKITILVTLISKSSLFPNRFMADIEGKPAFQFLSDRLRTIGLPGQVVLCTTNMMEDDALYEAATKAGCDVVRVNEQTPLDMVGAACLHHAPHSIVVHIPGENVLIDTDLIERGLEEFQKHNLEYFTYSGLTKGVHFDILNRRMLLRLWPFIRGRENTADLSAYFGQPGLVNARIAAANQNVATEDLALSSPVAHQRIREILRPSQVSGRTLVADPAPTVAIRSAKDVSNSAKVSEVDFKGFINHSIHYENPRVTVYIPAYNYGKYIDTAIKSVLQQTFRDWELIIVNDGSTDNTEETIRPYATNPRIKIISNLENKGLTRCNNLALRLARGEYIVRLDADDYFDENALLVLVNAFFTDPSLDLIYPDYYLVDSHQDILTIVRRKKIGEEAELLDLPAHGACTMIRTAALREVGGYNEDIEREDEFDLWLRCYKSFKISNVNLPLFYYRKHGTSLTDNQPKIFETKRMILRKHADERHRNNGRDVARLGIIPVRAHTDWGYHTHLNKIGGKTPLEWAVASAAGLFDLLVIVSEDPLILNDARKQFPNLKLVLRSEAIARPNVPLRKTIEHVLNNVEESERKFEEIAVLFLEYPLRTAKHVQQALDTLTLFDVDSVVDVLPTDRQFFIHGKHGLELTGSQEELRLERKTLLENVGSLLVIKRANLKGVDMFGAKRGHIVMPKKDAFGVHSPLDLKIVDMIMREDRIAVAET